MCIYTFKLIKNNKLIIIDFFLRCLPGDSDACGNGGRAVEARLDYPKGVAVAVDGTVFIADGRNIRVVTPQGKIDTLIGHHK